MLVTGIVREINCSSSDNYINNIYKVEIPLYRSPFDVNAANNTFTCTCSLPSGIFNAYKVGDMVYLDFINENLNYPVILGKIYKGIEDECRSSLQIDSLKVANTATFTENVTFGKYSLEDIIRELNVNKNINITDLLSKVQGYDQTKSQTLKNDFGIIKWVDD